MRLDRPHLMLTDFKMPGMTGLELLKLARSIAPTLEVIVMTAYGTVETAVEAMKEGAADFVTKPLRRADIVRAVRKALERRRLVLEVNSLWRRMEEGRRLARLPASCWQGRALVSGRRRPVER